MNVSQTSSYQTIANTAMKYISYPLVTTYVCHDEFDNKFFDKILKSKSIKIKYKQSNIRPTTRFYPINATVDNFDVDNTKFYSRVMTSIVDMYDIAYNGNIPSQEFILEMYAIFARNPLFNVDFDELGIEFDSDSNQFFKLNEPIDVTIKGAIITDFEIDVPVDSETSVNTIAMVITYVLNIDDAIYLSSINFNRCLSLNNHSINSSTEIEINNNKEFSKYVEFNEYIVSSILSKLSEFNNNKSPFILNRIMTMYSSVFNRDSIPQPFKLLSMLNSVGIDIVEDKSSFYRMVKPLNLFNADEIQVPIPYNLIIMDNSILACVLEDTNVFEENDPVFDEIESFGMDGTLEIANFYNIFIHSSKEETDFLNSEVKHYVDNMLFNTYALVINNKPMSLEDMVIEHYKCLSSNVGNILNLKNRDFVPENYVDNPVITLPHLSLNIETIPIWYFLIIIPVVLDMYNTNKIDLYLDSFDENPPEFINSVEFTSAIKALKTQIVKTWN